MLNARTVQPGEMTTTARRTEELPKLAPPPADAPRVGEESVTERIDAYWNDVEDRVAYLLPLVQAGRYAEALTLCAVYLEGVAHTLVSLNPVRDTDYTDELDEHSADPYLTLVHPIQLIRMTSQIEGLSPSAVLGLQAAFPGPDHTLLYTEQAVEIVRATLATNEARTVERAIWRCTVAYVIYDFINQHAFRRRDGGRTVGLGTAFREGPTVQGLNVPELVSLLFGMIVEARARCHARGVLPG